VQDEHEQITTIDYYQDTSRNEIGWCCGTSNLIQGCEPVSEGCANCWATEFGYRQTRMNKSSTYKLKVVTVNGRPCWTGVVELASAKTSSRRLGRGSAGWCSRNSMSDPFIDQVPDEVLLLMFQTMHLPGGTSSKS
jgi:protein gp37